VTVSRPEDRIDTFIRSLYAASCTEVVRIICDEDLRYRPTATAGLLAAYIQGGFDAVLTGCSAGPADNAQVPCLVAELLDIPCVGGLVDLAADDGGLRASFRTEFGIRDMLVTVPAVYAFSNARHTYLRVATLREKLAVKDRRPVRPDALPKPGRRENAVCYTRVYREEKKREGRLIEGGTPEEKTRVLFEERLRGVLDL
jgi:electron transfer flavoprotein alpha/beta subunit